MRSRITVLVVTALLLNVMVVGPAFGDHGKFRARLRGGNEVPAVTTDTTGNAVCTFTQDRRRLRFRVVVRDGVDVTQAHIHVGRPGENGPVVAFLYGFNPDGVNVDGELSQGVLRKADLIEREGVFNGTMRQLRRFMSNGKTYVNVHTIENPGGEVRGRLRHDS